MVFRLALPFLLIVVSLVNAVAQGSIGSVDQDSLKGSITKEREWWDVQYYDIHLDLDLVNRGLTGKNVISFDVTRENHSPYMQIDLQEPLAIDSIVSDEQRLKFERMGTAYFVETGNLPTGANNLTVYYSGTPKESKNPPYDGGIVWGRDSLDRDWISVACQMVGGSVWYPCKDHYSEEPDRGASLTLAINDSLGVVVGNGRLKSKRKLDSGKTEYAWTVTNPINNYGISFYIGHYVNIHRDYEGGKGKLDLDFWVLDYNYNRCLNHLIPESVKTIKAFEKWFGPYPFYEDGMKMVESSYIGMEHQSAVAYGNKFRKGRFSFKNLTALDLQTDRLIVHELAHEWFGNNITMSDMADRWVQEGFAAYGEELFIEESLGRQAGRDFFVTRLPNKIKNKHPLISDYGIFKDAGPDMYFKGWAVIHMLREIVNDDEKFRSFLHALNLKFYHKSIYSRQLEAFCSEFFGKDLSNLFDQYLRRATVPVLEYSIWADKIKYRLVADVAGLELPIKLNSPDKWIMASSTWKVLRPGRNYRKETLTIDPNFLVDLKRLTSE